MQNNKVFLTIIIGIIFFIVFTQFLFSLRGILKSTPIDFLHYYLSSSAVLSGKDPYIFVPTHFLPNGAKIVFNYPPTALIFFFPLAFFPPEVTRIIWEIVIFISLLVSIKLSLSLLKIKSNLTLWFSILSLSILSFPIRHTFGMGQVSIIIFLFLITSFYFLEKGSEKKGALYLSFAVLLKAFPLIILPFIILKKRWKYIFYLFIFITFFFILITLFIGLNCWKEFFAVLPKPDFGLVRADYYEQNITAFVSRSIELNILKFPIFILIEMIIILGTAIKFLKQKAKNFTPIEISLLLIVAIIATGFNWQHYFTLMIFPFLTLYKEIIIRKDKIILIFIFILSYILVSINIKNPIQFEKTYGFIGNIFLSHEFIGSVIVWITFIFIKDKKYYDK